MASPMPRPSAQREPDEAGEDGQTHYHPGDVVAHTARMETMQHVHRAVGRAQGRHPLGQTAAVAETVACGPDPERHLKAITKYLDAGFDEVYINQIGPEQEGFFHFYERELQPKLGV